MSDLISVILPTFNRCKTIEKAVRSVLNQTYQHIEVIVVDDASTDNTEEVLCDIQDNRLRYIKLAKNSGACVARNRGIEEAKGSFIAFQDSDDLWEENKLELQLDFLNNSTYDLVVCGFYRYEYQAEKPNYIPNWNVDVDHFLIPQLLHRNFISTQTILAKSYCFNDILFDEKLPRLQDLEISLRLAIKYRIGLLNKPLVSVFEQNDSISRQDGKRIIAMTYITEKHSDLFKTFYKDTYYWYLTLGRLYMYKGRRPTKYFKESFKRKPSLRCIKYYLQYLFKRY